MRALMAIAAALVAAPGAGPTDREPTLRLSSRQPPIVRGIEFKALERVRVSITAGERATKLIRATRRGVFVTTFPQTLVTRCDLVRIVAVGGRGSHAVLKILPAPMCLPARSP
jgi:hypothetical protein